MKSQIIIEVEPEIARRFETASPATREAIVRQLYETLSRETEGTDPVMAVLDNIHREAVARGLTPEIADQLIREHLEET